MPIARISVTLPRDVLAAADRCARELDRSRSWVVAEALRRYLAGRPPGAVREPAAPPYGTPGLGSSRLAQLQADLALTPEQRVREAESTARVAELAPRAGAVNRVLSFDRYEDYLEWKRFGDLTPS
jgi:hypothetical protein